MWIRRSVLGKALTDVESDAMELTLPVVPFGVKLAVAKSGSVAGAGTSDTLQPLTFPAGAEAGTRKLTIERDALDRGHGLRRARLT